MAVTVNTNQYVATCARPYHPLLSDLLIMNASEKKAPGETNREQTLNLSGSLSLNESSRGGKAW